MNINVIPDSMEKYMAFMLNDLVFIDSSQFMSSSLDSLVENLPNDAFKYTSKVCKNEKLNLIKQKGIYPYDYMDSFNEKQLPKKEDFYCILNNENMTDEQYQHAKKYLE